VVVVIRAAAGEEVVVAAARSDLESCVGDRDINTWLGRDARVCSSVEKGGEEDGLWLLDPLAGLRS
jgi:hypothetical protein